MEHKPKGLSVNHFKLFSAVKGKSNYDFLVTSQETTSVHTPFKWKALLNLFCSLKDLLLFALAMLINLRTGRKGANIVSGLWRKDSKCSSGW